MFCNDKNLNHKLFYSHNFGHNGPLDFHGLGINGKISELQSAMGLAVFDNIDTILLERKNVVNFYNKNLEFTIIKPLKLGKTTNGITVIIPLFLIPKKFYYLFKVNY